MSFPDEVREAKRSIRVGPVFLLWIAVSIEAAAGQEGAGAGQQDSRIDSVAEGSLRGEGTGSPGGDDNSAGVPEGLSPLPIGPCEPPEGVLSDLEWDGNVAVLDISDDSEALDGHGPCVVLTYEAPFDMTLFVSASSLTRDCFLQVRELDGAVVTEDDDSGSSGSGTDALIRLEVSEGASLELVVSVAAGSQGPVLLKVFEARETDETLALAVRLQELAAEAQAAIDAGRPDRGRTVVRTGIELVAGIEAVGRSWALASALARMGHRAWDCGDIEATQTLQEWTLAVMGRMLPTQHPSLLWAREYRALSMIQTGDLVGARALQESVLAERVRTLPADHPMLLLTRESLELTVRRMGSQPGAVVREESELLAREQSLPQERQLAAQWKLAATMFEMGDLQGARALQESVLAAYERTLPADHPDLLAARVSLARTMQQMGDLPGARVILESVLAARERTLPADHPALLLAQGDLALTMREMGDLSGARALEELVLAARERALPADHPALLVAQGNLALTMREMGDLSGARALEESVLAARERALPTDHPRVLAARLNLAATMQQMGDLPGSRALFVSVLAAYERTLPADHPHVLATQLNLAATIQQMGDLPGARALLVSVLAAYERTLPADHPALLAAQQNLAGTMRQMGDLPDARALFVSVLAAYERTLPADHPALLLAQGNLAATMQEMGDLPGARALLESVLATYERTFPVDHPDLLRARGNLAATMVDMGDLPGARALLESVLAAYERTLPPDHPLLLVALENLAWTMQQMGDLPGARAIEESVLAAYVRTLPADHPDLLRARGSLAATMVDTGDLPGARTLLESVLAAYERTLPPDHPDVLKVRVNLAVTMVEMGYLPGARALLESVLAACERTLPADHPLLLAALGILAETQTRARDWGGAGESILALIRGTLAGLEADHDLSRSQLESYCLDSVPRISVALSFLAARPEAFEASELFRLTEAARSVGAIRERVLRQQVVPVELKQELAPLEREILDLGAEIRWALSRTKVEASATVGATDSGSSGGTPGAIFTELHGRKQRLEAERMTRLTELARSQGLDIDASLEGVQSTLATGTAAVGFWGYTRWPIDQESGEIDPGVDSLLAFVVRQDRPLQRIELGAVSQVRAGLADWFASIGAQGVRGGEPEAADPLTEEEAGRRLRGLVFDPLRESLGDCRRVVLALDGPLHLVPFGALPGSAAHGEVGVLADRFDFEVLSSLKERTVRHRPELHEPSLLVVGGIRYDQSPEEMLEQAEGVAEASTARASSTGSEGGSRLASHRSGSHTAYRGRSNHSTLNFDWLRSTREELRDLESAFELRFEDAERTADRGTGRVTSLSGRTATREAFLAQASGVRFLHLATHAYVEDETVPCIFDARAGDGDLHHVFSDRRSQARGLSPLSITGVAFAGANLEDPERGGSPGVVTAAEIADLDLSGCELVVFSACGSSVGIERAGLGLASLQQAALIAGARMTLSSLYKVPDEATRDLMRRFYDRWWIQGMKPRKALESAQRQMREEKDPLGGPRWSTRDWAGWVMTGDDG